MGFVSFGIFGMIFRSSIFEITTLEIEGDQNLLGARLINHLEGLKGKNIFGVRSWELEETLESLPGIKQVWVEKVFPHTLRITVEERKPEIALEGKAGLVCLDEEGVEVPCRRESSSPVVMVRGLERYTSEYENLLQEVLALVATWRNVFDYPLEAVEVAGERLFILRLRNGIVIKCGGTLNLKNKAGLLRPYLREVDIRSIRIFGFDLRAGEDIVIMTEESR
ncbi:MAG: FtsQ-type POTRA domain-containing protein [Atribacterota bacterium]|nr:FtsQ-type POTRA domain-containing protein [Atribacterota bacterium]